MLSFLLKAERAGEALGSGLLILIISLDKY
jgi:hypothetical protein